MSPQAAKETLRSAALDAVKVMFERAVANGLDKPAEITITDDKIKFNDHGPLQDCEFGMILVLSRRWSGASDEFFDYSGIGKSAYGTVVIELVTRTVSRLLDRLADDDGGGNDRDVFFTAEPYSKHTLSGSAKYSANLDAAMITAAFLMPAIEEFNEELHRTPWDIPTSKEFRVTSLRDAALYVVCEAMQYALDCCVTGEDKKQFLGFTCDPDSNKSRPEDGHLELATDRLFFTWTACETIRDMREWRDSFLDSGRTPEPSSAAKDIITERIALLETAMRRAGEWCRNEFKEYETWEPPDPKDAVGQINALGTRAIKTKTQQDQKDDIAKAAQHVYHLSQYLAIRSLAPGSVQRDEIDAIIQRLSRVVKVTICDSGLDDAVQPDLFRTLTRRYSLGKWDFYEDDAWYPLVVRSISGMISRKLIDLRTGSRTNRAEIAALWKEHKETIQYQAQAMIARHAHGSEPGTEKLWSYATGKEYVLYATQRTVFALMSYRDLLDRVQEFEAEEAKEPTSDNRESNLSRFLANRLAEEYFRPIIREWLDSQSPQGMLPTAGAAAPDPILPKERWAANLMRDWLGRFAGEFEGSIANYTQTYAERLAFFQKLFKAAQDKFQNNPEFSRANKSFLALLRTQPVGWALQQLDHDEGKWDSEKVRGLLLVQLFADFVVRRPKNIQDLTAGKDRDGSSDPDSADTFWDLQDEIKGHIDSLTNMRGDPGARR